MKMKTCTRCKLKKTGVAFSVNKSKAGGVSSYCKECNKQYLKNHYANNKPYYRKKRAMQSKMIREYIKEAKRNSSCTTCGESNPATIDFHHNGNDKIITMARAKSYSLGKVKKEIDKCIKLCANCHRKLHFERFF